MQALAESKALGLTRRIGISNVNIELTKQAVAAVGEGGIAEQHRATVVPVAPVWDGSGHKGWLTPPWRPTLSPASG